MTMVDLGESWLIFFDPGGSGLVLIDILRLFEQRCEKTTFLHKQGLSPNYFTQKSA